MSLKTNECAKKHGPGWVSSSSVYKVWSCPCKPSFRLHIHKCFRTHIRPWLTASIKRLITYTHTLPAAGAVNLLPLLPGATTLQNARRPIRWCRQVGLQFTSTNQPITNPPTPTSLMTVSCGSEGGRPHDHIFTTATDNNVGFREAAVA